MIAQKSYSKNTQIPKPFCFVGENGLFGTILFLWGNQGSGDKIMESIIEYFFTAQQDSDITSPFGIIDSISPTENALRNSLLIANDMLLNQDNLSEYSTLAEVFCFSCQGNQLFTASAGDLFAILSSPQQPSIPVSTSHINLSYCRRASGILPSLPFQGLGLNAIANIQTQSFALPAQAQLTLIKRSHIPLSLWNLKSNTPENTVKHISRVLLKTNGDFPHWIASLPL